MGLLLLSLPQGILACLSLFLLSRPANASTQSYLLDTSYSGSTFFNGWNFWTDTDPTHGFVQYLSNSDAQAANLISQGSSQPAYMGVDHTNTISNTAQGRKSVRITTQKSWTHGLFIADIAHMPDSTCGVWPAFWMFGPNWPNGGEIDMIEGVSRNTQNLMSLHTGANCVMTPGTQSGKANSMQCDGSLNGNSGCGVNSANTNSYGTGFNNNGGGVYATEWTSNYIQTWFFPKGSIPSDITNGSPNPRGWSTWGIPQSYFQGGSSCNIDTHFMNQSLVFDTTFCGDWAGNAWGGDPVCASLANSCVDYVAGNPSDFSNAYWQVNSVKVYTLDYSTSSTTTFVTSTKTIKKSSIISPTPISSSQVSTVKVSSTTSTKASTTSSWTALGCYSDNVNNSGRALPQGETIPGGSTVMTVEACQSACKKAGYLVAGLEYSQECWCGNSFLNGSAYVGKDGTSGCNMVCGGDSGEWCGGSNRLSAWKWM